MQSDVPAGFLSFLSLCLAIALRHTLPPALACQLNPYPQPPPHTPSPHTPEHYHPEADEFNYMYTGELAGLMIAC